MDILQKIDEYYKGQDKAKKDLKRTREMAGKKPDKNKVKAKKLGDEFMKMMARKGESLVYFNVEPLIREIDKLAKNEKAQFGKDPLYMDYLNALKDFKKYQDKLEDVWDKLDDSWPFRTLPRVT